MSDCEQVVESGAYVLGILDPDDRAAYERHLRICEICQREVADFAGLPSLLAQLDPEEAAALDDIDAGVNLDRDAGANLDRDASANLDRDADPDYGWPGDLRRGDRDPVFSRGRRRSFDTTRPFREARDFDEPVSDVRPAGRRPRPLPSVPRSARRPARSTRVERGERRRQRRWQTVTAGLAAAACLALGVLVGARLLHQGPGPKPPTLAMRAVDSSVPIAAQVALDPFSGGTQIRMHCVYSGGENGPQWTLKMFVYPKSGDDPEQVSTWTAKKGDDVSVAAATRFAPADIGRVELRRGDATPLLVYENA